MRPGPQQMRCLVSQLRSLSIPIALKRDWSGRDGRNPTRRDAFGRVTGTTDLGVEEATPPALATEFRQRPAHVYRANTSFGHSDCKS
jgi:hypothetical protein